MPSKEKSKYKRILLKLSGEALAGDQGFGIDPNKAETIAQRVTEVVEMGIQLAIVIGAGNLWRGRTGIERGMDRTTADHMGMLGTVMNALALMDAIERAGHEVRVQTAIEMRAVAEPYIRRRAIHHIEAGHIVIFGAGTGNPYFSTDSTAALRGMEIDADVMIKATKVDGIYDTDPKKSSSAKRYDHLSYSEALGLRLGVMDATAISLCRENNLPIIVLNFWQEEALKNALLGKPVGTLIDNREA